MLLDDQDNYLKEWVQDKAASAQSLKTTETLRYFIQQCSISNLTVPFPKTLK